MAIDTASLRRNATKFAADFSTGQKAIVGIAVIALLSGAFMFSKWASAPTMAPLFGNLEASDASEITSQLSSKGVSYQLADNGRSILVPQNKVYQLRIDMASAGLPAGSQAGYGLLDKQGITASEFRQKVDYQRALEGELAKTIAAIDGVDAATVHLVIPADDVFANDSRKPSASVLVKMRPGKNVDNGKVAAIVNLVSGSIEGLATDDVRVADSKGKLLNAPGMSAGGSDASNDQQSKFESSLTSTLQAELDKVLGPNHAGVTVHADLDFDNRHTVTERFNTDSQAPVVSESITKETFTGSGSNATGVLGAGATNPITQGGAAAAGGSGNYTKDDAKRDFANGKITEEIKAAPGSVKRLTVAVTLDTKAKGTTARNIQQWITAAAGIDPARGDSVAVVPMTFDTSASKDAAKELSAAASAQKMDGMINLAKTIGTVLLVAIVLLMVLRSARKRARAIQNAVSIDPAELEAMRRPALSGQPVRKERTDADLTLAAAEPPKPLVVSEVARERMEVDSQIGDLIEKQPDEVAALLRSWLADRRS